MITVEDDGARMFLNLTETSIKDNRRINREEAQRLISTRTMNFTASAYEKLMNLTKNDLSQIITNIGSDQPISVEPLKAKLEKGFRRCYSLQTLERLRKGVEDASKKDFTEAETIALNYLPSGTTINSTIYLTVDSFNPGMVRGNDIGLSILSDLQNLDMHHLAHELHHVGYMSCISRIPTLERIYANATAPKEVAVRLILHLVSEGLANHYCTPDMVRTGENKSDRVNTRIRGYEENLEDMLQDAWSLIRDSLDASEPIDKLNLRLMEVLIDEDSILPKVHFLGERLISILDDSPEISQKEIIDLCNHPEEVVQLYNSINSHLPKLQEEYEEKLLKFISCI